MKTEQGFQNALIALDRSWWDAERKPLEFTIKELMGGLPTSLNTPLLLHVSRQPYFCLDRFMERSIV